MLFKREAMAKSISDRMHLVAAMLKTRSRANFTDSNHSLEFVMLRVLNALFGWELKDLNAQQQNFPAADLGDTSERIAFQITNEDTSYKIKRTTETAQQHHLGKCYQTLIIFFLLPRKPGFPKNFVQPAEGPKIQPWDLTDLLKKMLAIPDLTRLSAASAVLDKEGIPDPWQSAPNHTRVPALPAGPPKAADELFGREEDLAKVLQLFTEKPRLALTGDGGLGKTALSAALLEKWRKSGAAGPPEAQRFFSHDFYKAATLVDFHSGILAQAGIRAIDSRDDAALAAHALRQPGVLLYLEGAERLAGLPALLDLIGPQTALLLTTRHPGQAHDLPSYRVEPLSEAPAIALLHHHARETALRFSKTPWSHDLGDPAWSRLARDLGGLPLACQLAGIHCGKLSKSPAAFHQQLKTEGLAPLSRGLSSKDNLNILWRSAAIALIAELPGEPSPAITAWHCLTLGGTNPTPFSVLQALGAGDEHALTVLIDHGLAESSEVPAETQGETEPGYSLTHSLLSEWARRYLLSFHPALPPLLSAACAWGETLRDKVVSQHCVAGGEGRYALLITLATTLLAALKDDTILPPVELYSFYYLPARMHELHGQYTAAEPIYRQALTAMDQQAGPNELVTANALANLAMLLKNTLRPELAEPLMRRTYTIYRSYFGDSAYQLAPTLSNLGQTLSALSEFPEAEELLRRAVALEKTKIPSEQFNLGVYLNNLALVLKRRGQMEEAQSLMRESLAIDEQLNGLNHAKVATRLNNLAQTLSDPDQLEEAEHLLRRALTIDEDQYGKEHSTVAVDLNNLGRVLMETGKEKEAEPLLRRSVRISLLSTLRNEHEDQYLREALRNYAALCLKMDLLKEEFWQRMFAIAEEAGMEWERMEIILAEVLL